MKLLQLIGKTRFSTIGKSVNQLNSWTAAMNASTSIRLLVNYLFSMMANATWGNSPILQVDQSTMLQQETVTFVSINSSNISIVVLVDSHFDSLSAVLSSKLQSVMKTKTNVLGEKWYQFIYAKDESIANEKQCRGHCLLDNKKPCHINIFLSGMCYFGNMATTESIIQSQSDAVDVYMNTGNECMHS